ncbi:MAG: UDP-2,3-diacylglucosamine diphosphatase [Gammaproteobacteria bacterium]|nr:UDP-2,3-diacylglucosamine diphosphatase [Gammaproteobacteria bacterium]NNC58282.1 UDP-2,3-diacylglucosamine diphosphatase [Woeseiaceae bacterium]
MTTLFISDLHLEASKPEIGEQFLNFLEGEATQADGLYILGDLFESWVGDDDPNPHYTVMKGAIRELVDSGVPVFFMHGNRDFMIGEDFAKETGVTLLGDPEAIEMHGAKVLLSHGDALCIDDVQYQQVRLMTRNPEWQAMMRAKPLDERMAFAEKAREQSREYNDSVGEDIMDVNQDAVVGTFRTRDVDILLHGHTHRPAVHEVDLKDRTATRIVLGDWYEQGSVVRWDENGPRLEAMPR